MAVPNKSVSAIVTHEPQDGNPTWTLRDVSLREIGINEVLIRVIATGICHTDLFFSQWPNDLISYPKILGHEGSGTVIQKGANVTAASIGDAVLLSFQNCNSCRNCKQNYPSFCDEFVQLNYNGEIGVYTTSEGEKIRGSFFGQSSFAQLAIVKETSIVNVSSLIKDENELRLFSPLGCGFQTGMGTVDLVASATENDTVVVLGLGGVGMMSIVGAKLKNCKMIIGVDRISQKLELAQALGATHVINTADKTVDLRGEIKSITNNIGSTITIDTTGNVELISVGMDFTATRGRLILLGVPPPDAQLNIHLIAFFQSGKILRGSIEGHTNPSEYIPKMINWYREGKLPIDKLVKFYPAHDFETALADMRNGLAIKPVLLW